MSYLTRLPSVPDRDDVNEGMAFFANTGPFGQACETCEHRGYWRGRKTRFNQHGRRASAKSGFAHRAVKCFIRLSRHGTDLTSMKSWRSCKYHRRETVVNQSLTAPTGCSATRKRKANLKQRGTTNEWTWT